MVAIDNLYCLSGIIIHSAGIEHAPGISRIHGSLFEKPWREDFIKDLFEQGIYVSCVATKISSNEPVGFLIGSQVADEAEILSLGVEKANQRLGVATALLSEFIKKVKDREAQSIFLEVSVANLSALNFYRKLGFAIIGRRKKYYEQKDTAPLDALSLSLSLVDKD